MENEKNEGLEKEFKKLENNIWLTRKCRIIASERLLENDRFYKGMSIYYSIFFACLTILTMIGILNEKIDILSLVLSIAVTIFIVYMDTQNYKDRYIMFKENYIKLYTLLLEFKTLEKTEDIYKEISEKYVQLLAAVENHTENDYISAIIKNDVKEKLSFSIQLKYIWNNMVLNFLRAGIILLPWILTIIIEIIF